MKIVPSGYEIMNPFAEVMTNKNYMTYLVKHIEKIGRTCYKSEDKITETSHERFVRGLINRGHTAMIEHASITVKFTCDRGISHEIVRHRVASFAQESTRYCNYSKGQFGGEISVIAPPFDNNDPQLSIESLEEYMAWEQACLEAEKQYFRLIELGVKPELARDVLPTSTKTEVVVTMNLREWRHFFELRALDRTGKAHPQIKELAIPLLREFGNYMPCVFGDLSENIIVKE